MLWQRMKTSTSLSAFLVCLLAIGSLASNCSAALILGSPTTLSSLTSQPTNNVVVGDKKFSEFTYFATGDMPVAANVNVIPIQDNDGNYGIRFQGFFADLPGNGGSDALITYKVEVTDPDVNRKIIDVHLVGNPNLLGDVGTVSVTETFIPDSPITIEIHDNGGNSPIKQADSADFPIGFRVLRVQKDIGILAGDAPGTISFVDQSFSQTGKIPEPTTFLMSILGIVGLVGTLRRRNGTPPSL